MVKVEEISMSDTETSAKPSAALAAELGRPALSSESARRIEIALEARKLGASLRREPPAAQSVYMKKV